MSFHFFIRKTIALGQKSKADPAPYGQGFNYQVEVGFTGNEREDERDQLVGRALKAIDHKLLGLDVNIVADPTTANICRWLFDELRKNRDCAVSEVRLLRGDGLICRLTSHN